MDFSGALDVNIDEVEKPPLIPRGTYIGAISKIPTSETVGKAQEWDKLTFPIKILAPTDDVDPDDLEAFGDVTSGRCEKVFMFNKTDDGEFKKSLYFCTEFLRKTFEISGVTFKEGLASCVGRELLVTIDWDPDANNPENIYIRVKSTAPIT